MIYHVFPSDYFVMVDVLQDVTNVFVDHGNSTHYSAFESFLTLAYLTHFLIDTNDFEAVVIMMLK